MSQKHLPTRNSNRRPKLKITDEFVPRKLEAQEWLDPINRITINKALKARATSFTTRQGQEFTINYPPTQPNKAWVSPVGNQMTPCGWFDLDKEL